MIRTTLVSTLKCSSFVLAAAVVAAACSSSDSNGSAGAGASGSGCPGDQCAFKSSPCLAVADNTGSAKADFRISQLIVKAPASLAQTFVQKVVINQNMRLPYDQSTCQVYGTGQFSWLFSVDSSGTLTTGGGAPIPDQAAAQGGTCFIHFTDKTSNVEVQPVQVPLTIGDDGSFDSPLIPDIRVPIFLDPQGTSVVLLPLHQVSVQSLPGGGVIDDTGKGTKVGNCIGKYRSDLDPDLSCIPEDSFTYFENGAALSGFIKVDESDEVFVKDLSETLCVLLSGDATTYGDGVSQNQHCKKDGNGQIVVRGDWDSASNTAKDGGDAFRLQAEFAASAIKIRGTATKFDCSDAQ